MTARRIFALVGTSILLFTAGLTGYALADDSSGPPGGGTLSQGYSVYGPFSGADASTAGFGTFAEGTTRATVTIRLPAYTIPNAGGGQDENHALALLQGRHPGVWIIGAQVQPGISGYDTPRGTLVVWLNRPAPTAITFAYWTFGIFQD